METEKKGSVTGSVTKWKILAIIFIILFLVENFIFIVANIMNTKAEAKISECYYNICDGYPDAYLDGDVCYCYDYDMLGNLILAKTKYMK